MNQPPELDVAAVAAAYRRRVQATCPEQLPLAMRVLDGLDPERWGLEWHLPWWLGQQFRLESRVSEELVLGNVLGLASIRLRDDLLDGDLDPDAAFGAPALSAALYDSAIAIYRAHFPPGSDLWPEIALRMADWRAATADNAAPPGEDAQDAQAVARHLARRGAPLRISAFAVCLLAGRRDAYPAIGECLDHALAAMVLFDHLCDWQDDLAAGRWNAFVAAASPHAQTAALREMNRVAVAAAMMARDAVGQFVGGSRLELARARALAVELQVTALDSHLAGLASKLDEHARRLQAQYRELGEGAAAILLGTGRSAAIGIQRTGQTATA